MWSMFLWFAFGPVRTSLWESCCVGCWWWVLNADWSGRSFRRHRRGYWCGLRVRNRTWDMDTGMDTDCEMRSAIHERCTKSQQKQKTNYRPVCDFVLLLFAYAIFVSLVLLFSCYFVLLFLLYEMFISPREDYYYLYYFRWFYFYVFSYCWKVAIAFSFSPMIPFFG